MYTLNIDIDAAGLAVLADAGQSVVVAQGVSSVAGTTSARAAVLAGAPGGLVAWLAFSPLEHNVLTWSGAYRIFATTSPLETGQVLTMASATPGDAQPGAVYLYQEGQFTPGAEPCQHYGMLNLGQTPSPAFGLAAEANINNTPVTAPASVIKVLYNQEAGFNPQGMLLVFVASIGSSGSFVGQAPDSALKVPFSLAAPTASIRFADATNTFVPA